MINKNFRWMAALLLAGTFTFAGCAEEAPPKVGSDGKAEGSSLSPSGGTENAGGTTTQQGGGAVSGGQVEGGTQATQGGTQAQPSTPPAPAPMPKSNLKAHVKISTNYGDITVHLYDDTPKHKENMLKLAREGYYNGTLFHRVMAGFMIQGGDPDSKDPNRRPGTLGMGGPGYQIPAEFRRNHFHKRGALAAARTGDGINPKRESSGSQFYIVHGTVSQPADLAAMEPQIAMGAQLSEFKFTPEEIQTYSTIGGAPFLDQMYTVFGEVVTGMEVVDKIAAAKQGPNNQPAENITMKVSVIE